MPPAEGALDLTELLLRYLVKTILPYEGISLNDGFEKLSEASWFTVSEAILVVTKVQSESDDHVKSEIVACATSLSPGVCKAMLLAMHIGLGIKDEGTATSLMRWCAYIIICTYQLVHTITCIYTL